MKFNAAFAYASDKLPENTTVAVLNGDVYLDHESPWNTYTGDLEHLSAYGKGNYSLALARAEVNSKGEVWKMKYMQEELAYSFAQDAWVFKTPLYLEDADFTVGNCPGSDNAIAERLHRAKRVPLNFCHVWRIYHLDSARKEFQNPGICLTNLIGVRVLAEKVMIKLRINSHDPVLSERRFRFVCGIIILTMT